MDALLHVLDLGDRLVAALDAGDLDGATETLREREALIASLLGAPPDAATPALAARARQQHVRLGAVLQAAQSRLHAASGGVRRSAAAAARYHTTRPATVLDTAPRHG